MDRRQYLHTHTHSHTIQHNQYTHPRNTQNKPNKNTNKTSTNAYRPRRDMYSACVCIVTYLIVQIFGWAKTCARTSVEVLLAVLGRGALLLVLDLVLVRVHVGHLLGGRGVLRGFVVADADEAREAQRDALFGIDLRGGRGSGTREALYRFFNILFTTQDHKRSANMKY